ncbi:MAG: hypothetical protein ABI972_18515 [Acidobacteriota bacterium]
MSRQTLRHALATLAYRSQKSIRGAPPEFAGFRASPTSRTPVEIVAHMADLFDWACSYSQGRGVWAPLPAATWEETATRYTCALQAFDAILASGADLGTSEEKLFQGPVADALTHTGQLAMLRSLFGAAIKGENYFVARIEIGSLGPDQASPVREFD